MKLTNFTPHEINIILTDKTTLAVPKSGHIIRVSSEKKQIGEVGGIAIFSRPVLSPITKADLPGMEDWHDDDRGIVSALALDAIRASFPEVAHRFLSPGELVRNAAGQPIGCLGLNT